MEQAEIRKMLDEKGFIDEPVNPQIKLVDEINRLKKEKNAVILSHYYVESDLQDIADFVGDSLVYRRKRPELKPTSSCLSVFILWPKPPKLSIRRKK